MSRPSARALLLLLLASSSLARADSLSLPDVVRLALARNERPKIGEQQNVAAEAALVRARAAFLPNLALTGTETLRAKSVEENGREVLRSNAASGALTLSLPLLSPPSYPLYSSAAHALKATRLGTTDLRRQVTFDAARAFFGVIAQQRVLSAAQNRLRRAEASLKDAQARAAAQLVSSNDVSRLEIDRASSLQALATAQGSLASARITLEYLLDSPLAGELSPPLESLVPAEPGFERLVRGAATQRPDLASAHETVAAAWASASEPALRFAPTLGAIAQAKAADSPFAADRYFDATLGLNLAWSIWDAGIRGADATAREAAARSAELTERALARKVEADVRNAISGLTSARDALKAAEAGVDAARRSAEETTVLYNQGLAKAIELVDANLSRFDAEVSLAGAHLTLRQAEMDVRAALGLFAVDGVQ